MRVGVPRELKRNEARVAITPVGVRELVARDHQVYIERGAGEGSGITDEEYVHTGAQIVPSADAVFEEGRLVLKVKEPHASEIERLGPEHVLFTFLHLAAYPEIAAGLRKRATTALAYETVELPDRSLPLLAPMSDIAGRMAAQVGARFLERPQGGRGVLICGTAGVPPARATVLGAGRAGMNAAIALAGMGAQVSILDINTDKLDRLNQRGLGNITTVYSSLHSIEEYVTTSDLTVGAVLVVGSTAPVLVDEGLVKDMCAGAVLVDISIDQGGTFATSRETTHDDPTYLVHDVVHYAVGNIPGAVPNTSTYALTNATLRYVVALADGLGPALTRFPELVNGVNVVGDTFTHPAVAAALGQDWLSPEEALGLKASM